MSDLVERLRESVTKGHEPTDELVVEAADEIERLRALLIVNARAAWIILPNSA